MVNELPTGQSGTLLQRILQALDAACGDYPAPGSSEARRDSTNAGVAGYWAMHRAADLVQDLIDADRADESIESLEWALDRGIPGVTIDPSKPRCTSMWPPNGVAPGRCVLNADHDGSHEAISASRIHWNHALTGAWPMTATWAEPLR